MPLKCSAFLATSLDGYIARGDGALDWLLNYAPPDQGEDYGYKAFFASVDTVILGRSTYELVSGFPQWPYDGRKVVVLSSRGVEVPGRLEGKLESASIAPAELVRRLEGEGRAHAYVDGGKTIQGFIRAGLLQEITITRIPILIGEGIPLFGGVGHDVLLELIENRVYPRSITQSRYRIATKAA